MTRRINNDVTLHTPEARAPTAEERYRAPRRVSGERDAMRKMFIALRISTPLHVLSVFESRE